MGKMVRVWMFTATVWREEMCMMFIIHDSYAPGWAEIQLESLL